MKYIIDSADLSEIKEAISLGVCGITANPSMYAKKEQAFYPFLTACADYRLPFLSGEVMGESAEEMLKEAERILSIHPGIVIKINFSPEGLKACKQLSGKGVSCAITLIFTMAQAIAAIGAGAAYIFPFVGRTDEYGGDGLALISSICQMVAAKGYPVKVVAASIKNLHQLEALAIAGADYAAIPYRLLIASLHHPLTDSGRRAFLEDWAQVAR